MMQKLHNISTVARITGVNAITLRAWERRYGLVKPKRTDSGHRLFTDDDVVRIKEILFWLDKGIAVGKVAPYLQHKKTSTQAHDAPNYSNYQREAIQAVKEFDQNKLDEDMNATFSLYPLDVISQQIYPKVLEALNEHWLTSDTAYSEKQFFLSYLRNKIASTFLQAKHLKNSGKVMVTTLDRAFSELELLFLASALALYGFEIVLLADETSPQEWPRVVEKGGCCGIVISVDPVSTQLNQVKSLARYVALPICVRVRTPLNDENFFADIPNITVLPANYHLLLSTINETLAG